MTQRTVRRSRLVTAIRAALRPSTATAAAVTVALATAGPVQAAMENGAPGKQALRPENLATRDEILFIDAHVIAPEKLLVGAKQGVETVILEEGRDALTQITEVLESRDPVAVHIVAHGEAGRLRLGDTWLDAKRLDQNAALLRRWFAGNDKADLLLYACKLAEGTEGIAFVQKLAEIAGADVAASDDVTGADGDWDLEFETGDIEAELAFSEITIDDYKANLGGTTFTVNDNEDTFDGECDEECTLRDALYEANQNENSPESDVIEFDFSELFAKDHTKAAKGATYVIYQDCEEYGATEGPFQITESVTIEGPGADTLRISGDESYCQLFYVGEADAVTFSDLQLGFTDTNNSLIERDGGCVFSYDTDLTLDEVEVYECDVDEEYDGGGVAFFGNENTLTIQDSVFYSNEADEDGEGGAILFQDDGGGSTLIVDESSFEENVATYDGGAIAIEADESTIYIRDSYFSDNYAGGEEYSGEGGAIYFDDSEGSSITIESSGFVNNRANAYDEGIEDGLGEGGAVFFEGDTSEITVRDSYFIENDAGTDGGAVAFEDSDEGAEASEMLVENSYFYGNDANYGEGGGINFDTVYDASLTIQYSEFIENETYYGVGGGLAAYGESGDVVIQNSLFAYNVAEGGDNPDGGGASFYNLDSVLIYATTFSGNYSESDGGGIQVERNESMTIVNSTFSYNEAYDDGGAMEVDGNESFEIRHTTIAFNDAAEGGGIHSYASEYGGGSTTVVLRNTIVSDNTAEESGPDLHGYSDTGDTPYFDVAFSLVSDTADLGPEGVLINEGGNIFNTSAQLGPLDDTLGPTPVHVPDPEGSPAIDAGDPAFVPPPDVDQRKELRVLGAATDMGSVEQEGIVRIIPALSAIGLFVMGLALGVAGFLGLRRRDRSV